MMRGLAVLAAVAFLFLAGCSNPAVLSPFGGVSGNTRGGGTDWFVGASFGVGFNGAQPSVASPVIVNSRVKVESGNPQLQPAGSGGGSGDGGNDSPSGHENGHGHGNGHQNGHRD